MTGRRNVAIDVSIVSELKNIVAKKGMSLTSYLRSLLTEALRLEAKGLHAPKALKDAELVYVLRNFKFILIPLEVVENNIRIDEELLKNSREYGIRIGKVLKELGIDISETIDYLLHDVPTTPLGKDKIIILPTQGTSRVLIELAKGIAEGGGLKVSESPHTTVIEFNKSLEQTQQRKTSGRSF